MQTFVVPTKFTAIDAMSPVVKGMAMNLGSMTDKVNVGIARQERLFRKLTPSLGNATKQLLNYASAGSILAGIGYSGKAIMDYETSIQSLSAVTGVSGSELDIFKKEIKDVATQSKKSATEVAGSFEVIGSMMSQYLTDPKALRQISEAGITLSKASRQELVPTLENLTSIMNQFDLKANQATDTINRLTAGEIVGSLKTSQVAESLQEFGAGAYSANVNLAESVALVEALAKQMKSEKIGVGARNILTVLDSAKGLDKKAIKDLKSSGVDLNYLMDKSKSLSERLHELSKISGNATKIVSVFGKENKTAAQVIFNQLGTYDEYLAKIKVTNEAEKQAAINSKTFASVLERAKNTWINYITTSDTAAKALNTASNAVEFLASNLDTIVSVGVNILKLFALWKGAIIGMKVVTMALTAATVVQNAVANAYFLVDMVKYVAVTRGISTATAAWAITQETLNMALLANPVGIMIAGIVALGAAMMYLNHRVVELRAEYQKKIDLNTSAEINKETDAVKKLVAEYWNLGAGIKDATISAIKFRVSSIDNKRARVESRIASTKSELAKEKDKIYLADLFAGGGTPEVGRRAELASQLQAQQETARQYAADKTAEAMFAKSQIEKGTISGKDISGIFTSNKTQESKNSTQTFPWKNNEDSFRTYKEKPSNDAENSNLVNALKTALGSQKITVELKNAPAGTTVSNTSGGVSTSASY